MTPKKITIHCSDSQNGKEYSAAQIKKDHLARGFQDIGYHFVIQPSGVLELGRSPTLMGAHVLGDNTGNIGVCLIGKDRFTYKQFKTLRKLLNELHLKFEIQPDRIFGHHEFNSAKKQGKTCPNIRMADLIYWYAANDVGVITKYMFGKPDPEDEIT